MSYWLTDHAINPRLAAACGVTGTQGGPIKFTYRERPPLYRYRKPDGTMRHPTGEPLRLYWPVGGWGAKSVLLCEGEGDTLAAASVLCNDMGEPRDDLPEILAGLCPVGLPGTGMPSDRVSCFLRAFGVEQVYLCMDGDRAGQNALERLVESCESQGLSAIPVHLSQDKDLSDILASLERATASGDPKTDYLAHLLADAEVAGEKVAA